jgi:capsular polysaccharide transport system permease protein
MKFLKRINRLFLITVVVPTSIAIIFFGLIASDEYTSVSSFLVRSPRQASASGLDGLLKGVGGFSVYGAEIHSLS